MKTDIFLSEMQIPILQSILFVIVAMSDKLWHSHISKKYIAEQRGNWQRADRQDETKFQFSHFQIKKSG